jgi:hypothetical protein
MKEVSNLMNLTRFSKDSNKKNIVLKMLIHTADVNTCGKTLEDYLKWNEKLYE